MCFELMWLVFAQYYHAKRSPFEYVASEGHFCVNNVLPVSEKLRKYVANSTGGRLLWSVQSEHSDKLSDFNRLYYRYILRTDEDSFQLLLYFFQQMFEDKSAVYNLRCGNYTPYAQYMDSFRSLAQLLNHLQ